MRRSPATLSRNGYVPSQRCIQSFDIVMALRPFVRLERLKPASGSSRCTIRQLPASRRQIVLSPLRRPVRRACSSGSDASSIAQCRTLVQWDKFRSASVATVLRGMADPGASRPSLPSPCCGRRGIGLGRSRQIWPWVSCWHFSVIITPYPT